MGGGFQGEFGHLRAEIEALRAELARLAAEKDEISKQRDAAIEARDLLDVRCKELDEQVQYLLHRLFGRKTEKLSNNLLLPFPEANTPEPPPAPVVLEAPDEESETIERPRRTRRVQRLRADLPKERIEITLPEEERVCTSCSKPMEPFGEEVTERIDYQPARVIVREYARIKYSCRCCQIGVKTPSLPAAVIEKGMAEPGLLAHIAVAKYADHLPLERQQTIFRRHGIDLPKSTMCDWIRDAADLLTPIVEELKRRILQSHVIQTDDTKIVVLDRAAPGGSRKGYLWVYVAGGDVVYDFTTTRGRSGPLAFLQGFHGLLQADAYAGYDEVFRDGRITEVGCWAHCRRKFFEAAKLGNEVAVHMVQFIRGLYAVEAEATELGLTTEQRRELRQQKSRPLLELAKPWVDHEAQRALPQGLLGKAFAYCRKLWTALTRYIDDGRVEIDNNAAEREMRRVAVGRKNWEFAGSDDGARRAAVLYSLIATCRNHGVEPWEYLTDVLVRISTHPAKAISELTPAAWKAARARPVAAVVTI